MSTKRMPSSNKYLAIALIVGFVAIFTAANAHLLYVALKSQPDCVEHLKSTGSEPGDYRAAKSAC